MLNETTDQEHEIVQDWLKQDKANEKYFNQFKTIWNTSRALAAHSTADENKAWKKFQQRVHPEVIKSNSFSWLRAAAAVILIAGACTIAYLYFNKTTVQNIVTTAIQNTITDTLSDGSLVTLNKASSVSYPSEFVNDTRTVELKGEAFFNISKNKKKPFIIKVNDIQVKVTGTSFNIKEKNDSTEIIVETGTVEVTWQQNTITLFAGERVVINKKNTISKKEIQQGKLYNYYRSKEFVCDDTPLWKLVNVLNEAYNTNIIIGNENIRNLRLNATFNEEPLDRVLEIIGITFDIKVIKNKDQIVLE